MTKKARRRARRSTLAGDLSRRAIAEAERLLKAKLVDTLRARSEALVDALPVAAE